VEVDADGALAAAAAADERLAAGERTPVLGLTAGIKDLIDVAGLHTTYGSRAFADNVAERDAPAVARLRQAGAVILGKVNTTEFALFSPNTIAGFSKNPWDLGRSAGGSSNGSGTTTSAGLSSFSLGTDVAGSIRTPSSFDGVFGLKPTHGRVPAEGFGSLSTFMDTIGPMARGLADIALVLQVIAGFEPSDLTSADRPVPSYPTRFERPADGLVVAAPEHYVTEHVDPEVHGAWRDTLDSLADAGARIVPTELPDLSGVLDVWRRLVAGDAWAFHRDPIALRGADYSDSSRGMLEAAASVTAAEEAEARRAQFELRRSMLEAMAGADALVLPVTPTPAFTDEELAAGRLVAGSVEVELITLPLYCMPMNVTGQPALTVPVRLSERGLPLAVQVVGRPFGEPDVLRAGAAIAEVSPVDLRPPRYR
jgi:aspartyl-tRNA(Asn)/glutamyl-tRNA(Gln) amidotransferase subunit A